MGVVLTDPACVDGNLRIAWLPLSSVKAWVPYPPGAYRFNVGKSNKHINSKHDSTPDVRYAEVVTLEETGVENPKRQGELEALHVDGICKHVESSDAAPRDVRAFYAEHCKRPE